MDVLYTDAIKQRKPTAFNVMVKPIGPVCNLNCTYCYYLEKDVLYGKGKNYRMPGEVLETFIKQYIEAHEVPVVTFTWQGGEPTLLGLDFFKKVVALQKKYAGGKTIENAFQTNGTLLNDDWGKFFHDNKMLIGVSIDGAEHNHDRYRKDKHGKGTFKKVMKGIEVLHRHRVEFNTLSCVNDYNTKYAVETYRFLKNIGSGFMQFIPIVERIAENPNPGLLKLVAPAYNGKAPVAEWSVNPEDYGKFLIHIFDDWVRSDVGKYYVQMFDVTLANWVGAMPGLCVFSETCGDALVMEHNGDLYSCDHFVFPENYLGNIREEPLLGMVKSRKQFDFGINKRNSLPKYCLRCEYRFACHGECPKNRIRVTPDGEPGLNYLCPGLKMFFQHVKPAMDYMARELVAKRPPANVMNWIRNRENQAVSQELPGRNDPCPCGSGKKFKNCCAGKPGYSR
ncbi:MAG TPA: anaerobic sulfatase-maturation protein [Bacteroidetes bacterium]|mgnify:CR=1 FL=1|nr:anaerobic sulfatase-maturation protein [Bacteroidota bacterium]